MSGAGAQVAGKPWFREPWPWIIIGLLGTVVIASFITLWIAMSNPDALVVRDSEYKEIKGELRAQNPEQIRAAEEARQQAEKAAAVPKTDDGI
ncbi:MAG: FixH family protein [Xanthomonadales bacterium]|nr:FixH family protein [Xanthomonadales bacterium]